MSDGPYTEGWPKRMSQHLLEAEILAGHFTTVVPLSDAERMREALERIEGFDTEPFSWPFIVEEIKALADAALNPERGAQPEGEDPADHIRQES